MICCRPSRRDAMRLAAVVDRAFAVAEPDRALAGSAVRPVNLELVTLTEDRAILTWYTGVPGTGP